MTELVASTPPQAAEHRRSRAVLLLPAGASLLAGLYAAVILVTDASAAPGYRLADLHGVLMVLGFLGTLIALERAVALRRTWGYAAPAALGAGGLALVLPLPLVVGRVLLVVGCALAVAVLTALWQRQRDDATATQILAATLALGAAGLWTRLDVAALLPWLASYLVLTIAAERVELARLTMPASSGQLLLALATAVHGGVVASLVWPDVGTRAFGVALLVLVGWLVRADVARRTIHGRGLPRYAAAAILLGYLWLAVAAAVWVVGGAPGSEAAYDTVVHACFLGFAMSMVMAHAAVILPAVLRRPLPYRPALWAPLVVLHVGLAVRIGLGNALGLHLAWQTGSVLDVVALLLFVGVAAWSSLTAPRPAVRTR